MLHAFLMIADGGEYGRMAIRVTGASQLYAYEAGDHGVHTETVWMSHGDEAEKLPEGFKPIATSEQVGLLLVPLGARTEYRVYVGNLGTHV